MDSSRSPPSSATPTSAALGDFNGDTWADLALLDPGSTRVRIGINKAALVPAEFGFREDAAPVTVGFGAKLVDAGRFDADGRDDLVVVRTLGVAQGEAAVLLAQGEGFVTAGSAGFPLNATCLVVFSIDRAGTLDCAIGGAAATGGGAPFSLFTTANSITKSGQAQVTCRQGA